MMRLFLCVSFIGRDFNSLLHWLLALVNVSSFTIKQHFCFFYGLSNKYTSFLLLAIFILLLLSYKGNLKLGEDIDLIITNEEKGNLQVVRQYLQRHNLRDKVFVCTNSKFLKRNFPSGM
jgi:hypothetical protein